MSVETKWVVEDGHFILPSGNGMQATCHHRKGGACGGCYARMACVLDAIRDALKAAPHEGVSAVLAEASAAMVAEGKAKEARAR